FNSIARFHLIRDLEQRRPRFRKKDVLQQFIKVFIVYELLLLVVWHDEFDVGARKDLRIERRLHRIPCAEKADSLESERLNSFTRRLDDTYQRQTTPLLHLFKNNVSRVCSEC